MTMRYPYILLHILIFYLFNLLDRTCQSGILPYANPAPTVILRFDNSSDGLLLLLGRSNNDDAIGGDDDDDANNNNGPSSAHVSNACCLPILPSLIQLAPSLLTHGMDGSWWG